MLGIGFTLLFLFLLSRRRGSPLLAILRIMPLAYASVVTLSYSMTEVADYYAKSAVVRVVEGRFETYRTDILRPTLWPGGGQLCLDIECFEFESGFPGVGFRGRLNLVSESRLSHAIKPLDWLQLAVTLDRRIIRIEKCAAQERGVQ
jgi:hypothetical protein